MPISSQGKRRSAAAAAENNSGSQFVWRSSAAASSENLETNQQPQAKYQKQQNRKSSSTFQVKRKSSKNNLDNKTTIRQISQPNSCATTSMVLNNRLIIEQASSQVALNRAQCEPALRSPTLSLAGQLILAGKQPTSLESTTKEAAVGSRQQQQLHDTKAPANLSLIGANPSLYKFSSSTGSSSPSNHTDFYLSRSSLNQQQQQQPSQASSTTQLQPPNSHHHHYQNNRQTSHRQTLNISSRNMNLKYVKTLIIILMSLDLLMTILLHQFAAQDQMQIWLTTYRLRFSLLNLVLSAIWFLVLVGAILFDVHFILVIACIVDVGSFVLLLVLSVVHFYKRIDYNTVQLTSLLALLFAIIFLHVYLLAMSALTIYLTGAVRRRRNRTTAG